MRSTSRSFEVVSLAVLLLLLLTLSLSISSCSSEDSSLGSQKGGGSQGSQEGHQGGGKTRTYYIAADPVDWDYAPRGVSEISGKPFNEDEDVFVGQGKHRIGKIYRKSLYREYTDDRFTELEERPEDQNYLGTLGLLIRAEVGDTIKV